MEPSALPGKDGCGVMVEAKNSRMLTEALEELLLDENLRREIGTKARDAGAGVLCDR